MTNILNDIDSGILIIDREDRVAFANNFLVNRDLIAEDWENRKYYEVIRSLDLLRIISELKGNCEKEKEFKYKGYFFLVKTDQKDEIVFFIKDISLTKRFEEQTKEFLAVVSHELSTPISAVKGLLETIELKDKFDKNLIRKAIKRIEDIEKIIDSIRYLLMIEKEEGKVNKEINLKKLLYSIKEDLQKEADTLRIDVKITIEKDLKVFGDRERLYILFKNIIENAIKYNRKGGKVRVEAKRKGNRIKVSVADTGIGISKENMPFIFMPFFGGKNKRGMGLGLALCNKIANLYNIKINVESKEGKGSKFIIEFEDNKVKDR